MTPADVLAHAGNARVLIVGDICLDRWCRYVPALAEVSRETGIPRCAVAETSISPGAGGTVAANLAALGAGRVAVLGIVGTDGFGRELRSALAALGIEGDLLVESRAAQTFTYMKLINAETGIEDLPRVDFVNFNALEPRVEAGLIDRFREVVDDFDAVVIADQSETEHGGVATPNVRAAIREAAAVRPGLAVLADSRERVEHFRQVLAVPNEDEADEACRRVFGTVDYDRLRRLIDGPALVVTAGRRGAWLVDGTGSRLFGAAATGEPVDVCGAGDSLAAGLALALCVGADVEAALRFGIIVAGVTVTKPGTGTARPQEVLAAAAQAG